MKEALNTSFCLFNQAFALEMDNALAHVSRWIISRWSWEQDITTAPGRHDRIRSTSIVLELQRFKIHDLVKYVKRWAKHLAVTREASPRPGPCEVLQLVRQEGKIDGTFAEARDEQFECQAKCLLNATLRELRDRKCAGRGTVPSPYGADLPEVQVNLRADVPVQRPATVQPGRVAKLRRCPTRLRD